MKYSLIVVLLLLLSGICKAAVYMQTDTQGQVNYSDTPSTGAQPVNIPVVNSAPVHEPPAPTSTPTAKKMNKVSTTTPEAKIPYSMFEIISPKDQEVLQNLASVPVDLKIEPELQPGDHIIVLLDGQIAGEPGTSTHVELGLVERGMHQLAAAVVDENRHIVKQTNTITINVHRNSVITSPLTAPPPPPLPR